MIFNWNYYNFGPTSEQCKSELDIVNAKILTNAKIYNSINYISTPVFPVSNPLTSLPKRLPAKWQEYFEERAGIREHDGGQSRQEAEQAALLDTIHRMKADALSATAVPAALPGRQTEKVEGNVVTKPEETLGYPETYFKDNPILPELLRPWTKQPRNWDADTQELADWVQTLRPEDLPSVPFALRPGEKVANADVFLEHLQDAAAYGPDHPRNVVGVLKEDLKILKRVMDRGGPDVTRNNTVTSFILCGSPTDEEATTGNSNYGD